MKRLSLKLAVLSDLHLTNRLPYTVQGDSSRKDNLIKYLSYFFKEIKKERVDFLVVPGDLLHSTILDYDDLDLLLFFLFESSSLGIKVILCLGNHDFDHKQTPLFFLNHDYPIFNNIKFSKKILKKYFFGNNVLFDVVNFCSHTEFLEATLALLKSKRDHYDFSILVGHIGVKGTLHGTTKSIIGVNKEDIEKISENYDLVLLGHHHLFQWVTDNCLYCGSIHQTRIDEIDTVPGGLIISLPECEVKVVENKFSPRFSIIENYSFSPEDVTGKIVKPILDTSSVSESENLKFVKEIVSYNPYYLIKPRVKPSFKFKSKRKNAGFSSKNKRKALLNTMKEFKLEKEKAKDFFEHTIKLWESIEKEE